MTRLGKNSPFWWIFALFGKYFKHLFSILPFLGPTLAKLLRYWANIHCWKWQKLSTPSGHLVTLPFPFPENGTSWKNKSPREGSKVPDNNCFEPLKSDLFASWQLGKCDEINAPSASSPSFENRKALLLSGPSSLVINYLTDPNFRDGWAEWLWLSW